MIKYRELIYFFGSVILLGLGAVADRWQKSLGLSFTDSFNARYVIYQLWLVPIAALVFMVSGLLLFRITIKKGSQIASVMNFILGAAILFYPSFVNTFHLLNFFRIGVNYFNSGLLYFAGAFVTAMGVVGLLGLGQKMEYIQKNR